MTERVAILYEIGSGNWFSGLLTDMGQARLQLVHPLSGKVVVLDGEGEWQEVSQVEFEVRIESVGDLSFHLWFAPDHNLYCRVRRIDRAITVEFGMEACTKAELRCLRGVFRERFLRDQTRSLGFVFDPEGRTEGQDWDSFFLTGGKVPSVLLAIAPPFLLGFRRDAVLEQVREFSGARLEEVGELGLARW